MRAGRDPGTPLNTLDLDVVLHYTTSIYTEICIMMIILLSFGNPPLYSVTRYPGRY
jgi:hypothetical protein